MAPLKPHWPQPSHPDIQEVFVNEAEFTSKSISKIAVPPFGLYAKLAFPPCTLAQEPTYATVQMGRNKHLNLNSDLLYINHSCEPSLIFDTANLNVIAGPKGLQEGEELTFFYPSTEWSMAQPFDCLCGKPSCRGKISGANGMTKAQLEGVWLNGHIRELLEERDESAPRADAANETPKSTVQPGDDDTDLDVLGDPTAQALKDALQHAEKVVEAARTALVSYVHTLGGAGSRQAAGRGPLHGLSGMGGGSSGRDGTTIDERIGLVAGSTRRGPTSRELSGEMGGDTTAVCT